MRRSFIRRTVSLLAALALAAVVFCSAAVTAAAYDVGYYIKSYDVNISVNEDNTFDITETLNVYFDPSAYKHGIIRTIPLENTVYREDGTSNKNHVNVSDVRVNHEFVKSRENGNLKIKIGSADEYVSGDVKYVIQYKYDIGRDPLKDRDEFYFNIIGTHWDTTIENVTFTVRFPKSFDASSLGFTLGYEGNSYTDDVEYEVANNTVRGRLNTSLSPYEGFTMRLELPDGYFVRESSLLERIGNFLLVIPAVLLAWVYSVFKRKGSNEKPVEPVEFYPPDDMSPLEIGYIYDGSVDKPDVTSYLIHLANQGYLRIRDVDRSYEIELLKDRYDGDDPYAEMFFNGLAARSTNGLVEKEDLEDSFYTVITEIKTSYGTPERRRMIFYPTGKYSVLAFLAGLVAILLSALMLTYMSSADFGYSISVAGGVAAVTAMYTPFLVAGFKLLRTKRSFAIALLVFIILHMSIMVGAGAAIFLGTLFEEGEGVRGIFLIGLLCGFLCVVFAFLMSKRTEYGNEMLGRIRGFRNFLVQAEKPKLEALVEQDPAYFYNILPYTYVLGVSNKWIKKFDGIAMEPPTWYAGTYHDTYSTINSINHSVSSIGNTMMTSPHSSSDSGGGFSGGGFSGGGSGGGGGSSW